MNKPISSLDKLLAMDDSHRELAIDILKSDKGNFYPLDMVFLASLNRSQSNISAFIQLLEAENYCAAAPFIRMQLDSILRLYALRLVDNPNELSHQILKGTLLSDIKDRNNKRMSDAYLRKCIEQFEPWVSSVYQSTSGFIHLSEKHIFTMFSNVGDDGTFAISISNTQRHIPEKIKEEAIEAMSHITFLVISLCKDWLKQKSR